MGITDVLLSSLFVAVYVFRFVAHAKLTELIAEFLIGFLDTILRVFFWTINFQTAYLVRVYRLLQRADEAQRELDRIDREWHLARQQMEELIQRRDRLLQRAP
jgi:hypothetical protein